jgi:hypothetical protein
LASTFGDSYFLAGAASFFGSILAATALTGGA